MAYQTIPPSGSSSDWLTRTQARVKLLDSTLTRIAVSSYGTNLASDLLLGSAVGTGAINALATIEGGGFEVTSGATAGGSRVANLGVSVAVARFVPNARTSHWAIYMKAKIVTAVASGAEVAVMCNVQDGTNDSYLGQAAATSTANWTLSIGGVAADTGVAFDTNWNELLLRNDGTTITAYVNYTPIATGAASGIAAAAGFARCYASNAAVTGTVNYYIDRWAMFTTEP